MRFLFVALLLVVACGPGKEKPSSALDITMLMGAAPAAQKPEGGTFVWGANGDATKLDPAQVTDGESVQVITNIFDTLVSFAPGTTDIVPWLATEWRASLDQLEWTFKLRDDVAFHDGTPFNAEAVVFSFERQQNGKHPARNDSDTFPYFHNNFKTLARVEAVEEFVVKFVLREPYAPFLAALALFSASIVSPKAFEGDGKETFSNNPVGTGPFKFVSWERGSKIVLAANKEHFSGAPVIDRLVFKPIASPQAALQELEAGGIHGMPNPSLKDIDRIYAEGKVRLLGRPGINVCYLAMNTQKDPFRDKRVRQAVAFAIDKEALIRAAYDNKAAPAVSMCPESMRGHKKLVDRRRDVMRSKELLAEAGFPDGIKTTLWVGNVRRTYMPDAEKVALHLREDLKEAGIQVELKKMDWSAYLEATRNGEHDMCLLGWMADIFDPDNFLYVLLDKDNAVKGVANNVSFYTGERVHNLLIEAQRNFDWARREPAYHEAQKILFDEVPVIPLVTAPDLRVVRMEVRGYTIYPVSGEFFRHVSFEK